MVERKTSRYAPILVATALHAIAIALLFLSFDARKRASDVPLREVEDAIEASIVTEEIVVENAIDTQPVAQQERTSAFGERKPSSFASAVAVESASIVQNESTTSAKPLESEAREAAPADRGEATPAEAAGPPVDLGISGGGRVNPFLPKSEAAVEKAEAARIAKRILHDAARDRERALGLGPEGPVLTALRDGTSQSIAPVRGRAVFVATTNESGEVVAIDLQDAEGSGGRPSWADAARIALGALRGKKLRIPLGTTRAVMKIEVISAWKLPSGQDPGANVEIFNIPVSKGEGKDSTKVSILTPKIHAEPLELLPNVKLPIPTLEFTIFGTNGDITNIGAKPSRIIHTRLLDSSMM